MRKLVLKNHQLLNLLQIFFEIGTYTANVHGPSMVSLWSDYGIFDITNPCRNFYQEIWNLQSNFQIFYGQLPTVSIDYVYIP